MAGQYFAQCFCVPKLLASGVLHLRRATGFLSQALQQVVEKVYRKVRVVVLNQVAERWEFSGVLVTHYLPVTPITREKKAARITPCPSERSGQSRSFRLAPLSCPTENHQSNHQYDGTKEQANDHFARCIQCLVLGIAFRSGNALNGDPNVQEGNDQPQHPPSA